MTAGLLGRIEEILERAVEGSSRALFRQRLQPIELAKAASRAMDRCQQIGPDGVEVPNAFTITLHPTDFESVAAYQASLESRIRRYLDQFAEKRGLVPVAAISVRLAADPAVRRRAVRISAVMFDGVTPNSRQCPPTRPISPITPTAYLPRVRRDDVAVGSGQFVLVLEDGRRVVLGHGGLRIGRAPDNDLVISDSRVSRYHAQVTAEPDGPLIRDLGSTNGTHLEGRPVSFDRLHSGSHLSIGGFEILVQAGAPAPAH